jgi:hypothetical protein
MRMAYLESNGRDRQAAVLSGQCSTVAINVRSSAHQAEDLGGLLGGTAASSNDGEGRVSTQEG